MISYIYILCNMLIIKIMTMIMIIVDSLFCGIYNINDDDDDDDENDGVEFQHFASPSTNYQIITSMLNHVCKTRL
jgi:hypothetical protein